MSQELQLIGEPFYINSLTEDEIASFLPNGIYGECLIDKISSEATFNLYIHPNILIFVYYSNGAIGMPYVEDIKLRQQLSELVYNINEYAKDKYHKIKEETEQKLRNIL